MEELYTARAAILQPAPACCWVVAHRKLAGVDDLYTARAAIWQPAPAGCGMVEHRKLAGVDDLYTALAAILHPAPASCGVVAHRKHAGGNDLYAAIRQPALAGCGVVAHRKLAGGDDLYAARAACSCRLRGGGAQDAAILRQTFCWLSGELVRHLPSRTLYCMLATAWQPAPAGCWWLDFH